MWAKKKFVVEIDEKYVDQKNHQMLTYICSGYNKEVTSFDIQNITGLLVIEALVWWPPPPQQQHGTLIQYRPSNKPMYRLLLTLQLGSIVAR